MPDINYPPTRTISLAGALADIDDTIAEAEADEDARAYQQATDERDTLQWAVDQWGEGAEITLEAFSTAVRSEVIDTANRKTVGQLGQSQLSDWLLAAAVINAPWLEGGEDLPTRHEAIGSLPPALTDYLNRRLEDVNDLGN